MTVQPIEVRPEVKAATAWWAAQLTAPAQYDAGATSPDAGISVGLALLGRQPVTTEQIERFRTALEQRMEAAIIEQIEVCGGYFRLVTSVDYGPDHILKDALADAGDRRLGYNLPWKTHVIVMAGKVEVAGGYGAAFETIYFGEPRK